METMDELKKRLNSSSQYLQSNDMQVVEVKEGYAKVEMIIDEQILNVHGFVHGGALYSLADTAAGAASLYLGSGQRYLVRYDQLYQAGKRRQADRNRTENISRQNDRSLRGFYFQ